tara:strand:- start:1880 stop:3199 length:1320 start_codon:yes stop_codon:yes gene_type:complete
MDNNEAQMTELFEEGGIADDGMRVDPVSGNEIPPGSMASEVRDDVPAQLSEGEYVVPADVLRFYGVKFFEDLRSQAKQGLGQMEDDGRIGGEPLPPQGPQQGPEGALTSEELAMLQEMGMNVGGMVPQQRVGYNQAGLEDGSNINQSATIGTFDPADFRAGYMLDEIGGRSPTTTPVVTTVTLYGPANEIVTLSLPAQQEQYDELVVLGYTTEQTGLTTETSVGSDDDDPTQTPEPVDYYSTQTTESLQKQLESLKSGKGLNSFLNNYLDKGILGKVLESATGKTVMERSINSLEDELKKRDGSSDSSTDTNAAASGNSFTEGLANLFTPDDGTSYVNGQLVDDKTKKPVKPGIMNSKGNDNKGGGGDNYEPSGPPDPTVFKNDYSDPNNPVLGTMSDIKKAREAKSAEEKIKNYDESQFGVLNKGGFISKRSKKKKNK